MRVAVDTNVFIALFYGEEEGSQAAQHALERIATRGFLVVSPVVHSELLAGGRSAEAVDEFFSAKAIEVNWKLGEEVWRTVGVRYGRYARNRRRQITDPGPGEYSPIFWWAPTRCNRRRQSP